MPRIHRPIQSASGQTSRHERFLTVKLYPRSNAKTPGIRIQGKWLLKAGFTPQMRVRVSVVPGCLVILPDDGLPA